MPRTLDALLSAHRSLSRALLVGAVATTLALPVLLADASEANAQVKVVEGSKPAARPVSSKKTTKKRVKKTSKKRATRKVRHTSRRVVHSRTRTTHVASVYHYHDPAPRQGYQTRTVTRDNALSSSAWLDLGLGVAGADTGTSGTGLSAGFGMRKGSLGFGLSALGLFADSPDQTDLQGNRGLELGGLAIDGRLYLPLSSTIEPYGLVGLGYYSIGNAEDQFRPTLDLGVGADFKLNRQIAVGGRYVYNAYVFDVPASGNAAPDVGGADAAWEALGTVTVRF